MILVIYIIKYLKLDLFFNELECVNLYGNEFFNCLHLRNIFVY